MDMNLHQPTGRAPSHRLTTPEAVKAFALAGKARLTVRSKRTENRFTFRVKKSDDGKVYFVSLMNGPCNETSYGYMGLLKADGSFRTTARSKVTEDAASFKAFRFVMGNVLERDRVPDEVEVWHEGKCGRCGRALTVPESIASGIGPECRKHVFSCEGA